MATATAEATVESRGSIVSRREFLYYIWGASIALFTAEFTGLLIWFMIPKFREGEFGGTFTLAVEELPAVNDKPVNFAAGRFWLVNLDTGAPAPDGQPLEPYVTKMYRIDGQNPDPPVLKGVAAVYKVCTHLGCIYAWNDANNRFECPCHGSKYRLDGRRIESPAPRTLDRFKMAAVDATGAVLAESTVDSENFFEPMVLPDGTVEIQIDTGNRLTGPSMQLICDFVGRCP